MQKDILNVFCVYSPNASGPGGVHLSSGAWWAGREHRAAGSQWWNLRGQRHRCSRKITGPGNNCYILYVIIWVQRASSVISVISWAVSEMLWSFQVTDMMVANSHNLIVTVKPANQRNNVVLRGTKNSVGNSGSVGSAGSIHRVGSVTWLTKPRLSEQPHHCKVGYAGAVN